MGERKKRHSAARHMREGREGDMRYFNFQIPPEFRPLHAHCSMGWPSPRSPVAYQLIRVRKYLSSVLLLGGSGTESLNFRKKSQAQVGVPVDSSLDMETWTGPSRPTTTDRGRPWAIPRLRLTDNLNYKFPSTFICIS